MKNAAKWKKVVRPKRLAGWSTGKLGAVSDYRRNRTKKPPGSSEALRANDNSRFEPFLKSLKSHLSQCATAYLAGTLSRNYPKPAPELEPYISRAGGNVCWLAADKTRRQLFHQMLCQARGENIPYEQLWAEH